MIVVPAFLRLLRSYKWWGSLVVGVMGAVSLVRNWYTYRNASPIEIVMKSLLDFGIALALACAIPVPLFVGGCVWWIFRRFHWNDWWKLGATGVATIFGTVFVAWVAEPLMVLGTFASDMLTRYVIDDKA